MSFVLPHRFRKLILTAHIIFSVGWAGAVAVFLAHSIVGLTASDSQIVLGAYAAMAISCWAVIVPANVGSLLSGIAQAIFTPWGLSKHWWIAVKLALTVGCTILLLLHTPQIAHLAETAAEVGDAALQKQRLDMAIRAGGALLVLLGITAISVYKPWGRIQFRNILSSWEGGAHAANRTQILLVLTAALIIVLLFILHSHFGGQMHAH